MKFLLAAINAKYIHSSLAVRCIHRAVKDDFDVEMCEYTINDSMSHILAGIYRAKADVVAFSCYIWNFSMVLTLCDNLKKASPDTMIVLGGPEVSYSPVEILQKHSSPDAVVIGEGEVTVHELFEALENRKGLSDIRGIAYRHGGGVVQNSHREPVSYLDDLPFVYDDTIDTYKNHIIYYESSRGCPFSCSYCLSGERGRVRFLSMERVKKDIDFFVAHKVPLVKFVDRTFNADKARAKEIFKYIIDTAADTKFHMELAGDLLDDETIQLLSTAPPDIMQFEIGVQTTNTQTMDAINRKIRWEPLADNIRKLMANGNIHVHLDLIAGLPHEDLQSFKRSFNDVMALGADVLQLGFLKILDGSAIKEQTDKYGYRYTTNAPYEIISNNFISYDEILFLHEFEDVFERYYNNGGFDKSMKVLFDAYDNNYFALFEDITRCFTKNNLFDISLSKQRLYDILHDFAESKKIDITECLKFDYIKAFKSHRVPQWCSEPVDKHFEDCCYAVLKDEEFKRHKLPHYYDVPAKKAIKTVHFERFSYGVMLFDHESGAVVDVTEYFE
ncbi:MAG: B12-binding domain-containing radical SAM protein [Clostridia bacterium]|nr:B12-binding domain-containing radical SAM protein [Clostridia bacterium]